MINPTPLQWPAGRMRTKSPEATKSAVSLASARDHLLKQMGLLGATIVVITSNAALRKDGLPMSKQPRQSDCGVAVWFKWSAVDPWFCLSCDVYDSIAGNVRAIGLSVAEIRAFTARLAIPIKPLIAHLFAAKSPKEEPTGQQKQPPPKPPPTRDPDDWKSVLKLGRVVTWDQIQASYRTLAKQHHPDKGGNVEDFQKIQAAYEQAKKKFGFK